MLLELLSVVLAALALWYVQFRPRSAYNLRPAYVPVASVAAAATYDYVVVGGGPGGLAAARELLHQVAATGETVLLVERGGDSAPASAMAAYAQSAFRDRLLSFAPDLVYLPSGSALIPGKLGPTVVGECVDEGAVSHRPFRRPPRKEDAADEATAAKEAAAHADETLFCYTAYPRGTGIGGTAQLGWGVHLPSIFSPRAGEGTGGEDQSSTSSSSPSAARRWWQLPVALTGHRNPLSWAFAEAAASTVVKSRYMPTEWAPCAHDAVYPALLYLDVDGRRLPMAGALFDGVPAGQLGRLSVLTRHAVTGASVSAGRVDALQCEHVRSGQSHVSTITVKKGVVFSAGAIQTPRILRRIFPTAGAARSQVRDVIALPMIFQAQGHISADTKNTRDAKGMALWLLAQRGQMLQPITDTIAALPVPELGPTAEMRLVLLPFGGRDRRRFYQLGWDRALGSFEEGATILMVLSGVDGLSHPLEVEPSTTAAGGARGTLAKFRLRPLACPDGEGTPEEVAGTEMSSDLRAGVAAAFVKGMRACRELTGVAPLSHLIPARGGSVDGEAGREAIDCSLLRDDPAKALQLARLLHMPRLRQTSRMRRDAVTLLEWAYGRIHDDAYMRDYVAQHAYWLSFGSGSSESLLSTDKPFHVKGLSNAVVGDCSAVTAEQWALAGKDTLAAGSISSAVEAGKMAAEALTSSSRR